MDIKEAIKNIINHHKKAENNPILRIGEEDADQNYIKKEEIISEKKQQENSKEQDKTTFNQVIDELPKDYWRQHFKKKSTSEKSTSKITPLGRFYLHHGMKIDIRKKDRYSMPIIELMHIIRKEHTKNDIFDRMADRKIAEDKIKKTGKIGLISMINDSVASDSDGENSNIQGKELEIKTSKDKNDKNMEHNHLDHLRLEELYIKSVAVSLLAESDGRCEMAKEILFNGGMEAIKKMDVASLQTVLDQLHEISIIEYEKY